MVARYRSSRLDGLAVRLSSSTSSRWGWGFLVLAVLLFTAIAVPVLARGAPLLDDFSRCVRPQKPGYWSEYFSREGAFRPAKIAEIGAINLLCGSVPFRIAILMPWFLTLGVAVLLRSFLKDLDTPSPWPEIGAGLWLLAPLGTESALWPSALHVPLGLALMLIALRMLMRSRMWIGLILGVVACLSLEQLIFAFPLAAWWVSPPPEQRRILVTASVLSLGVLAAYAAWPGEEARVAVSAVQRLKDTVRDPESYASILAVGLGGHSIPTAISWAFPVSLVVLVGGSVAGWAAAPHLLRGGPPSAELDRRSIWLGVALLVLVNLPLALVFPHPDSPRVFTPTWLVLVTFGAIIGSRRMVRRQHTVGAVAGLLIAGSVLSLAFSSSVRVRSATIVEGAMRTIAAQTPDGGIAAVCGLTRTVVHPAPSGAFAVHEFFTFPTEALEYYTGVVAEIRVDAERACPDLSGADAIFQFQELIEGHVAESTGIRTQRSSVLAP